MVTVVVAADLAKAVAVKVAVAAATARVVTVAKAVAKAVTEVMVVEVAAGVETEVAAHNLLRGTCRLCRSKKREK